MTIAGIKTTRKEIEGLKELLPPKPLSDQMTPEAKAFFDSLSEEQILEIGGIFTDCDIYSISFEEMLVLIAEAEDMFGGQLSETITPNESTCLDCGRQPVARGKYLCLVHDWLKDQLVEHRRKLLADIRKPCQC
jgi:hypothetical protein